jgi:hypothetical protein
MLAQPGVTILSSWPGGGSQDRLKRGDDEIENRFTIPEMSTIR